MNRSTWSRFGGWCLMPVLLLALGCGSVSDPGGGVDPGPTPEDRFLANATGGDATVTDISVVAGAEYDDATETVAVFSLVSDQDGGSIDSDNGRPDLNEFNYSVTFDPKTAGRSLDTYDATDPVTFTRVTGVTTRLIAIIIDSSGSMSGQRMVDAKAAATNFVQNRLGAGDLASIIEFNTDAKVLQELTSDTDALVAAIATITADGSTNIGGAVLEGVRTIGVAPGRRAAILLTDGVDTVDGVTDRPVAVTDPLDPIGWNGSWIENTSSSRWRGVQFGMQVQLPVYTIGFQLDDTAEDGANAIADLEIVSRMTGADPTKTQPFRADSQAEIEAAYDQIVAAIDAQAPTEPYRLSFAYPKPPQPGSLGNLKRVKSVLAVPLRVGVLYHNGIQVLNGKFSDNFTITYP